MAKAEIIEAFAVAHIALFHHGPALTLADKARFAQALRAAQELPRSERIGLHEEVKAVAAACVGEAA